MKWKVLVGLAAYLALQAMYPPVASAEPECNGQTEFVVWQIILPVQTNLSPQEQAAIRLRLFGRCFDRSGIAEMAGRVRDGYQHFGYFAANVAEPMMDVLEESRHPRPVSLTFSIDEGPQYSVRAVRWLGVMAFKAGQIWPAQSLKPGDILDTDKVRDIVEGVRRLYVSSGFPNVSILPEIKAISPRAVEVTFRVQEGSSTQAP